MQSLGFTRIRTTSPARMVSPSLQNAGPELVQQTRRLKARMQNRQVPERPKM
jgi:hypothetical protein